MIKVKDKTYRNLEEQVQYLTNYHDVNQGIAQWGIRVVGQVTNVSQLPNDYTGEFGDTYAVGTKAPFSFYIWTRAAIEGGSAYWFPFGEISIVGPQGPEGKQGEKGETGASTKWYTAYTNPASAENYNISDLWLNLNNGAVFQVAGTVNGKAWNSIGSIRGPQGQQGIQGPQGIQGIQGEPGPKGETGDVGGFINIVGIITNANQLPDPADIKDQTAAYLVGTAVPYDLYIQIGGSSSTAVWTNVGAFNVATRVLVNGQYQSTWEADIKLDKRTNLTAYPQVYAKYSAGAQGMYNLTPDVVADAVVQRQSSGDITVPSIPIANNSAICSEFVKLNRLSYRIDLPGMTQALSDNTINYTGRNPNATFYDPTLTGNINAGAFDANSCSLNGNTIALGSRAIAVNNKTIAKGAESMAGGYQSVTLEGAESSLAFGEQNITKGNSSVAFGNNTQALGDHTLTYGYHTKASQPCAIAGGNGTEAAGENSVAFGVNSIAAGTNSLSGGAETLTTPDAYAAIAYGEGLSVGSPYQAAFGRYNENISGNIFEIGNGESFANPHNVFSVTRDGRAKADTLPTDNNDLTNKYYVDNKAKLYIHNIKATDTGMTVGHSDFYFQIINRSPDPIDTKDKVEAALPRGTTPCSGQYYDNDSYADNNRAVGLVLDADGDLRIIVGQGIGAVNYLSLKPGKTIGSTPRFIDLITEL